MLKGIVHTRVVSTVLIVVCIVISAGLSGYFLDLYKTGTASANQSPVAEISGESIESYPTVPLTFDGSASTDPDGEIISYEWEFGDGFTGIGAKPSHEYELPGTYTAVMTVKDNDGATDSDTVSVVISEDTEGTGMYALVTVNELIVNGSAYLGKLVRVAYATVTDAGSYDSGYGSDPSGWVKFAISDNSTDLEIEVYCQGGATRPLELSQGDLVNVSALLDEYNGDYEMNVRVDTLDRVKMCPSIYYLRTLSELFADRLAHHGELVRIEGLIVVSTWTYGWYVKDLTVNSTVSLYAQLGANVSMYVNVSDIITMQGVFTYYDYDQDGPDDTEWELKVRDSAQDMVLRTYEFDWAPTISSIARHPAAPSPFAPVTVNATVTDNVQVAAVQLHHALNGGAATTVAMSRTSGNFFEGVVPAAPHLGNVTYFITAQDNKGQETTSPTSYYVSIDTPPAIVETGQAPEWVRPADTVVVWAIVEDDGGISSAYIAYSTDGWNNTTFIPMLDDGVAPDNIAGDMAFNGTLGSFAEGTVVDYYIGILDTAGNSVTTGNISFMSSFDQPPIFGAVYRSSELPADTEAVRVIANVTDDFMLLNVTLVYDAGTGSVTVNMTRRADGNWQAEIPAQAKLAHVSYHVNATDNASHTVRYPAQDQTYTVGYGVPTVLYATGHGEYVGGFDDFGDVVRSKGYRFIEGDLNSADLEWVEFIIISDPETAYTAAELDIIDSYVRGGGGLLLLSETDYDEYGRPENCNPILQHLGIEGRFNDDSLQDEFNCLNYPTYATIGTFNGYGPHIPFFNFLHRYPNATAGWAPPYAAGDYEDWGCFDTDTTGITSNFVAEKKWIEGYSASSIYNVSEDIVIIQSTDWGYNVDNDAASNEAYYYSYPKSGMPGHVRVPFLAANASIGSGRVVYGGLGRTLGDGNYYGWTESNVSSLAANIADWLINVPPAPGPTVSDVVASPAAPTPAQTVTVSATVTGAGQPISRVTLRFSVNGSYYVSREMALSSGKYSATIPRQAAGAVVTYYIQAVDDAGTYAFWPTQPEITGIGWYTVQGARHILISEFAYNVRDTDTGNEYVELYNPLPAAISLEGWWLEKKDGEDNYTDSTSPFPSGSMIAAYGYFLVCGDNLATYLGMDAMLDFDYGLPNSFEYGYGIKLYDGSGAIVDRVGWNDDSLGSMPADMYEALPFQPPVGEAGSVERLPTLNSKDGNYIDTDNNSADFAFRFFEDPQGSFSTPEYPPWTASVTSPYLLPDDHPVYQVTSAPPAVEPAEVEGQSGLAKQAVPDESLGSLLAMPGIVFLATALAALVRRRKE